MSYRFTMLTYMNRRHGIQLGPYQPLLIEDTSYSYSLFHSIRDSIFSRLVLIPNALNRTNGCFHTDALSRLETQENDNKHTTIHQQPSCPSMLETSCRVVLKSRSRGASSFELSLNYSRFSLSCLV